METKKEVSRRYAKYIFLDVVQFSSRSAEAQSEIVQHLNKIVRQTLDENNVNYDEDCILIPTGDGMCIALISPNLPYDVHIQIALNILELIQKYNESTENETRRFQVRIGINQNTDILVTDINGRRNVAGAGINLASRVMDKADDGQILVSQAVFHELQPSEAYMGKFKAFLATGKHDIRFQVYQYIADSHPALNIDVPSAFVTPEPKPKKIKLSEQAAYYFAQAIIHKQDLLTIKSIVHVFWEDAAVCLLRFLAYDEYKLAKTSEFGSKRNPLTFGSGRKSFDEQYEYYASQDIWVRRDANFHIVEGDVMREGLELYQYSECFELSEYRRLYLFLNKEGIEKLKEEWPDMWEHYELDKYI